MIMFRLHAPSIVLERTVENTFYCMSRAEQIIAGSESVGKRK